MSHLNPGLISAYNSLTDKHLAGYFSNTRIRRHLHRAGLITRSGRIVPDKEYRHKLIQRAHQRHVRECLAQAIFHKVLEMERLHQIEIKRKLEEFARRERVHKIKVERSKRYEEEIRILSPRPPMGARVFRKQHSGPEGDHTESSESPGSSRPNTAPGKMQRPARLEPLHSNSTTASLRPGSPYRLLETANKNEQPFNCTMGKESRRRLTTMDTSQGISPYCLPVINNFVTPVPPATKRKDRGGKPTPSSTLRGRRLRPTTASSGADVSEELPLLRSSVYQSRVCVNMIYFGKTVHLSNDLTDMRDEVKVFQQHCGGENLCVYKGRLREGEMFQFISRRHRGFPFSLTFFLNGLQVERLSSCCEFKHRKGSRLGGRHGHFGFCSVEGASPCYKCIIAMGLDKKPTPPPKRVKDNGRREDSISSPKDATEMETERTAEDAASHSECETRQPRDMETPVQDKTTNLEDKVRDDYEEDFEADDEGPAEDPEEKEKGASSPAAETEVKQKDASESEDNVEDEDARSNSGSSDKEESEAEAPKAPKGDEETGQSKEADQEEAATPAAEKEEANPEEAVATEAESFVAKDSSELLDSAADSTEIDISDASAPSGTENKQSDNTSADKEDQKTEEGSKEEEEQERAKSVQEKLAEAILKESHCSSEPELSDTSTEEEEESTNKGHEQNNEVPEKSEPKREESIGGEVEEEREETSSAQEPNDDKEEPCESNDGIQEEAVRQEEAEKVSTEVKADVAKQEKTEETEGADEAPPPECEVEPLEAPQVQDDAAAKVPDVEAAEEDKGGEEQAAVDEAEAKGPEEDESSVSEMNQKADEAAEAAAPGQTIIAEMKADHSEEREALCFEEAPEGDAGERREDAPAGLETEVTAENSSSSSEGSGDTAVRAEKTDGTRQDGGKDETYDEEEASGVEESEKQTDVAGEETTERSEGTEIEKVKSEEESKEEEKEMDSNDILGENTEKEQTVQREEEGSEKMTAENEGNDKKTDLNIEEKSKTEALEEEIPNGETEDREEKEKTESAVREDDEVNKQVTNEDAEEESEEKEAERNEEEELNTIDDKQTGEAEEMEEKDAGNKDEVSEHEKIDEEEENITSEEPEERGEKSEVAEGTMKRDEGDNDVLKMSDENTESEVATEAEGRNGATEETFKKESVKESHEAGRGEVDAENGEMSTTLESKSTRAETPAEVMNDQAGEKETDKENLGATTEELVESADTAQKQSVGIATPTAEEGLDAEEGDAVVEKQDESNKRETSSPEVREKSDSAENKDQEDNEKKENIEPEVSEEVSPEEHVRPSAATEPCDALRDEEAESGKRAEEQPAGVEASAADGENGAGTEDASKASEEGASVLLKPQAQPTALGIAGGAQSPETLEKENSADLVTNWVTLHQTSKYFETFVEPLEELKGSERRGSANGSEGDAVDRKQGGETHTEEAGQEAHEKDAQEAKNASTDADDEPRVVDPVMELTEETGESKAVEEETQSPKDIGEKEMVRIEVESIPGSNHSGASGKPQSIVEEKPTSEGQESDQKPPQETEGPTSPESGEHRESPVGPSKPADATPEDENNRGETQEVTEVTEFAKSDVGSQQETNSGGPELRPTTDGSVDGDKRGAQLIHEIGHTISKERLSTFSVDETLFGRASYPLLTAAARTESGH